MNSFRAARASAWQHGCLISASLLVLWSAPVLGAPKGKGSRSAASNGRVPSPAASVSPAAPAQKLEFADAYPSSNAAAPDLLLEKEASNKAEALVYFSQALIAEDQADTETALEKYRRALELDPSYSELAVKVAFELAKRNDASGGIQILKDAVRASPKEPLPLIYLSQLYSKHLKKPDLALKYAEQAVALDPNEIAAHLSVLEVLLGTGQQKKAEAALERATKSENKDATYWLQLGEVYQRMYIPEDGSPIAQPVIDQMNAVFRKAAELGKDDAVVQAKVGNYFADSKQQKEAVHFFLAAVSLKQKSEDPVLINVREKLAHVLLQMGEQDEAIKLLEAITKEDPLRFATFELLGELYEQKGDVDRALASYQHSLLLDASEPLNHLRVAELQVRMKRYDEAVETAKVTRAKFPDNPQAIYMLPIILSQAKKHTDAMTAFAAAQAEFEAEHEELLNASFYFAYGAAAEQAGLTEKAAELLKKCIELEPNSAAQAYNYLGYMWVDRNENLEEAGAFIQKALEQDPENGAFIDSLGWYYFRRGENEKALKELLRAAQIVKPEDPVVYDHIADVYHAMGNHSEALRYWQKSLELDQEQPKVAAKLEAARQKAGEGAPKAQAVVAPAPQP
jgi:tetratricopeptide (TPR) repeat protein